MRGERGTRSCWGEAPLRTGLTVAPLSAAARNMMFATAIMLSKESAPGGPGVAIGINQSACSLGAALGPMLCGLGYTQALFVLRTSTPFFLSLGVVGLLPGVITQTYTPKWPWH